MSSTELLTASFSYWEPKTQYGNVDAVKGNSGFPCSTGSASEQTAQDVVATLWCQGPLATKPQGPFLMSCPQPGSLIWVTAKGCPHPVAGISSCPCQISQGSCWPIPPASWNLSKWQHCPQLHWLVPSVWCHLQTRQVLRCLFQVTGKDVEQDRSQERPSAVYP